jgi:hypothetical protein
MRSSPFSISAQLLYAAPSHMQSFCMQHPVTEQDTYPDAGDAPAERGDALVALLPVEARVGVVHVITDLLDARVDRLLP